MQEDLVFQGNERAKWPPPAAGYRPVLFLLAFLLSIMASAGLCVAAIAVPAPTAVAPLVAMVCVGAPVFAGWEAHTAILTLRAQRLSARAVSAFRRRLAELPETDHPLEA
jgi:hypothetical protein